MLVGLQYQPLPGNKTNYIPTDRAVISANQTWRQSLTVQKAHDSFSQPWIGSFGQDPCYWCTPLGVGARRLNWGEELILVMHHHITPTVISLTQPHCVLISNIPSGAQGFHLLQFPAARSIAHMQYGIYPLHCMPQTCRRVGPLEGSDICGPIWVLSR